MIVETWIAKVAARSASPRRAPLGFAAVGFALALPWLRRYSDRLARDSGRRSVRRRRLVVRSDPIPEPPSRALAECFAVG